MTNDREPTLLEACRDLNDACHTVFVAPLLPLFTRILDTMARWLEKVTP